MFKSTKPTDFQPCSVKNLIFERVYLDVDLTKIYKSDLNSVTALKQLNNGIRGVYSERVISKLKKNKTQLQMQSRRGQLKKQAKRRIDQKLSRQSNWRWV